MPQAIPTSAILPADHGSEIMMAVPGELRWRGRLLQQLWRGNQGTEEWRTVPTEDERD